MQEKVIIIGACLRGLVLAGALHRYGAHAMRWCSLMAPQWRRRC